MLSSSLLRVQGFEGPREGRNEGLNKSLDPLNAGTFGSFIIDRFL
jgi:hypothetical protein